VFSVAKLQKAGGLVNYKRLYKYKLKNDYVYKTINYPAADA